MRSFGILIANFFQKMFMEKVVLVNLIALPILLIGILGTSLSSIYNPKPVKHVPIGVVYESGSQQYKPSLEGFFADDEVKELLIATEIASVSEARHKLGKGAYKAVLIVPEDTDLLMSNGEDVELKVLYKEKDTIEQSIIAVTLSTLTDATNSLRIAYEIMPQKENGHQFVFEQLITDSDISGQPKTTAMNYYGVTMTVLVLFYGLSFSINNIHQDFKGNLGVKLRISPIPPIITIISLFTAGVLVSFAQASIVILFSKFVFNVYFGKHMYIIFLITLLGSMFFNVLGLLLGVYINNRKLLNLIMNIGIPVMIFIAGGYYRIDLGLFSFISPVTYIQTLYFTYIYQNELLLPYTFTILLVITTGILLSLTMLSKYKGVQVNEDI
ncbi:ABC-2 family transporter protein [compost metagenome]